MVVYNEDDPVEDVMVRSTLGSKFLGWMECNRIYPEARSLTYAEFPTAFVWYRNERKWKLRSKKRKSFAIGRITYVPAALGEVYYLRVLLNVIPGPTSFDYLKTVKGVLYETFKEACFALGLLDDDKEYVSAIKEASMWCFGVYLRKLFVIILVSGSVAVPVDLWVATRDILSEDILFNQRNVRRDRGVFMFSCSLYQI